MPVDGRSSGILSIWDKSFFFLSSKLVRDFNAIQNADERGDVSLWELASQMSMSLLISLLVLLGYESEKPRRNDDCNPLFP
ncbi:Uncharacterized protein TCM_029599 [Theobroma cacao]|uniref:Uncharacterized protein n=1 Tax=Theobroma cacao TaxID=3641 RepID=A0A061GFD9_THECC|nr:Uncharacterized protein TCM_029599 [Theobroma cacao]